MAESVTRLTCEAWQCSWIRQPNNVASSGFFFVSGAYLYFRHGLRTFAILSSLIAVGSMLAHSGEIRPTGFFDFLFQFLFFAYLSGTRWPAGRKILVVQIIVACLSMALVHRTNIPWLAFFIGQSFFLEWRHLQTSKTSVSKNLMLGVSLFFFGLIFFWMDVLRIGCDPDNHWYQPHGVWHLCTALGLVFVAKHYSPQHKP